MTRISEKFGMLKQAGKKAFVTFLTAGDPDLATTLELVWALERGGADIIELGVPFSDPMADGPVIQKASERALLHHVHLKEVLHLVTEIRKKSQVPLVLMGYYNPILAYGLGKFAKDARSAGVDGVLVVDLPPEEAVELDGLLLRQGLDMISLLTPTSDVSRIEKVLHQARGFVYFVSMTGVTGGALKSGNETRTVLRHIRQTMSKIKKTLPVAIGFGISTPEQVKAFSTLADGVVVGSALVSFVEKRLQKNATQISEEVESWVRQMTDVL